MINFGLSHIERAHIASATAHAWGQPNIPCTHRENVRAAFLEMVTWEDYAVMARCILLAEKLADFLAGGRANTICPAQLADISKEPREVAVMALRLLGGHGNEPVAATKLPADLFA